MGNNLPSMHRECAADFQAIRKNRDIAVPVFTLLSKTLTELEQDGIVQRKEYMEVPARVEYSATPLASELKPIIYALAKWGNSLPEKEK